jgi:hypothetical protein
MLVLNSGDLTTCDGNFFGVPGSKMEPAEALCRLGGKWKRSYDSFERLSVICRTHQSAPLCELGCHCPCLR